MHPGSYILIAARRSSNVSNKGRRFHDGGWPDLSLMEAKEKVVKWANIAAVTTSSYRSMSYICIIVFVNGIMVLQAVSGTEKVGKSG